MPGSQIDELLDIWAAKYEDPPFTDHKDLYCMIDPMAVGDAPWSSFLVTYSGPLPEGDQEVPPWMLVEYEVWHHDPCVVLHQQLGNTDFDGGIHYTPFQETDANGERHWQDIMSGNWVCKQAMSSFSHVVRLLTDSCSFRILLPRIPTCMEQ